MKTKQAGERAAVQVAPSQRQDWPLACICNLCQCGNHRCSTFSWDEERAARLARGLEQQSESSADMDASRAHGACNHQQREERYLTRDPNAAGAGEANRKWSSSETPTGRAGASRQRQAATVAAEPKHSCDDEMLHVLVTRPEIAGRPRDNIVFEGDMDLKSTFETSYNALARMRLEHWKRHQEARNARAGEQPGEQPDEQQEVSVERDERKSINRMRAAPATPDQTEAASERAARRPGHKHQHGHQRARASDKHARSRRQVAARQTAHRDALQNRGHLFAAQEDELELDELLVDGENYLQDTPKRQRPKHTRTSTAGGLQMGQIEQKAARMSRPGRLIHSPPPPSPPSPAKQLVMASPISRVRSPTPIDTNGHPNGAPEGNETPPSPKLKQSKSVMQQQAHTLDSQRAGAGVASKYSIRQQEESSKINDRNDPIDPDLAPIICYDSNMNRLERVGLRKRSKYRPSTSLRPGGFFGDETAQLDGRVAGKRQQSANNKSTEQAAVEGARTPCASPSGPAGATSKELGRGNDVNISGRRHLLDHMGRVDHIKEAELEDQAQRRFEDKSTLTEALVLDAQLALQAEALSLAAADQQAHLERRLAEEEESAAVAEIERCTREPLESLEQAQTLPEQQTDSLTDAADQAKMERARTSSRQSRQQRVCQDQSFSICENEYPEARGAFDDDFCIKIGGRASSSSRASQREQNSASPYNLATTRVERGKNLFRESPDFILTTGNSRQQQSAAIKTGHAISRTPEGGAERHLVEGRSSQMSIISENDAETTGTTARDKTKSAAAAGLNRLPCSPSCRVLNLDNQYEFVGSRLGHKYFVERDSSLRDPVLISETA